MLTRELKVMLVSLAAILTVSAVSIAVIGPDRFFGKKEPQAQQQSEQTAEARIPSADLKEIDGEIDALMRGWAVTDVCYDRTNTTFLFKVFDHTPVEGRNDAGWYMLTAYKFAVFDNGTYALLHYEQSDRIDVNPAGLYCKSQPVDPSWGKTWIDE